MKNIKLLKLILRIIRIIIYLALFITFAIIPTTKFIGHSICLIKIYTGYDCPTCGVTRAFSSIMHLKFIDAYHFNSAFTLVIFPIVLFIIINDIINMLIEWIARKETCSYLEHLFVI